jgi:hypothetical protein
MVDNKDSKPQNTAFSFENISNLFSLGWKASLVIGVLISFMYFYNIGFVPIHDFQSLIHLAFFIALTGVFVFAWMGFALLLPPFYWSELLKMPDTCAYITNSDKVDSIIENYKLNYIDISIEERRRIASWYVGSILICFLLAWSILSFTSLQIWFWLSVASFFCSLFFIILGHKDDLNKKEAAAEKPEQSEKKEPLKEKIISSLMPPLKIISFSIPSASFLILLSGILGAMYSMTPGEKMGEEKFLILVSLLTLFASLIALLPPNKEWNVKKWALVVGFSVPIVLSMLLGFLGTTSTAIMRIFKLGALPESNFVVDKKGCQMLAMHGMEINCKTPSETYLVKNVHVLWRVGEYAIRFTGKDKQVVQVIFPSSHVIGLIVKEKKT